MKKNSIVIILVLVVIGFIGYEYLKKHPTGLNKPAPVVVTPVIPFSGDTANLVRVSIKAGDTVKNGQVITGAIKGGYFFEAHAFCSLFDANHDVIAGGSCTIKPTSEWMTADPVDFTLTIATGGYTGAGYIQIHNDNPSDMRENDKYVDIPVVFQ